MILKPAVLIVGGGPAGATAARFLAEEGIETLLVERDFSYVKPCGGGIPSGAITEFSLPWNIVKKRVDKILIVSPENSKIEIALKDGFICITERCAFDACLRKMAQDRGALLIEGEFTGFEAKGSCFVSNVRRKADGAVLRVQSSYILAADGITFSVGRKSGQPALNRLYTISSRISGFEGDSCEFWFGSSHASNFYSWVFPSAGNASIGTGSRTARECPALLREFLQRRFRYEAEESRLEEALSRYRIFPVPAWRNSSFRLGRILFLGDAAAMVMPVTYEGIYYAMKSGQFAAAAVLENSPHNYRKLWEARFGRRFRIMDRVKDHFFRDNRSIEKWVAIHKSPAVQELAMRLWLLKKPGNRQLFAYLKAFGSLLSS
ncbi:MAG TPA: geranylgeranyl reductase family protein [Dissulfurispiraceae bacterium]|nr:geranylgeranyl reductase family protein [Dissulfurispiraceae bacterium]